MLIEFAHTRYEKLDRIGDVLLVAHLDDLVNVSSGKGNCTRDRASRSHPLETCGVCSPSAKNLWLPSDLLASCHRLHEFHHPVVADHGGIHDLDRNPFSQTRALFLRLRIRRVERNGGIESKCEVGLDLKGRGIRSPQSNFLLHREHAVEIIGGFAPALFQHAQCF